jgi:hypothetical protein
VRRQVVLFAQQHPEAAAGGIAGNAGAVDPATNDQQIVA